MAFRPILLLLLISCLTACGGNDNPSLAQQNDQAVPPTALPEGPGYEVTFSANSWIQDNPQATQQLVTDRGIRDWQDPAMQPVLYFATDRPTAVTMALKARLSVAKLTLQVFVNEQQQTVTLQEGDEGPVAIGHFELKAPGYHTVRFTAPESAGSLPELEALLLWPEQEEVILTELSANPYWGRRGPSVHFSYEPPVSADIQWFYSEVTVPQGQDVPGSYFMANGFAEGYFGIQVNSGVERRVLFSVWSPYQTDDPDQIPADQRIQLLRKGDGVYTGEFGNEGAGGQSYLKYSWQADTSYSFLLQVQPDDDNSTAYTAWFKPADSDDTEWQLIAAFRRPQTQTHATRLHSFLENFLTEYGDQHRMARYHNQWVRDTSGIWHELTRAVLTADATARAGDRFDYSGTSDERGFVLENGGFFYPPGELDQLFERQPSAQPPVIDWDVLP
ncbi:DUF3472 domain-containing protein [Bowmanella dokdonensis]|uniref:DUF3472 domain-containing protein n=1 Tax=Bowmanella dokdonensis TaxID=751969 RepID=A0A939DRF2_9ALTE|nr:DUF3472 domain-containing protein [Bowmanella dokdonensis]MBN7827614.1 DUF3472 domain-containing protein [Bowmanella dokdonensis]